MAELDVKKESVFDKEQLKKAEMFKPCVDIVDIVMKKEEKCTKKELQKRIDSFLKREVR